MKKVKFFSLFLLIYGGLIVILVSCGSDDDDAGPTALTLNQAQSAFLASLIVTDTVGGMAGTLAGVVHVNSVTACPGGGSVSTTVIDSSTDTLTFAGCVINAADPDSLNGSVTRILTDSNESGIPENVMITLTSDLTQKGDFENDGGNDSTVVWTSGTTMEINGFQNSDVANPRGLSKSTISVNGSATTTLLGNSGSMRFANFDIFLNLQDPGTNFVMELAMNGKIEYSDNCVTIPMLLEQQINFKLPYGPGFSQGTVTMNDTLSVLDIKGVNVWMLTLNDSTSKEYTQAEFEQFPATCP